MTGTAPTYTITVHTKTGCPHCDVAKAWLDARGIAYSVELHDDDAERQALYDRLGLTGAARTVPQVLYTENGVTIRSSAARLPLSGIEDLCR